jgi:hypothetical protein
VLTRRHPTRSCRLHPSKSVRSVTERAPEVAAQAVEAYRRRRGAPSRGRHRCASADLDVVLGGDCEIDAAAEIDAVGPSSTSIDGRHGWRRWARRGPLPAVSRPTRPRSARRRGRGWPRVAGSRATRPRRNTFRHRADGDAGAIWPAVKAPRSPAKAAARPGIATTPSSLVILPRMKLPRRRRTSSLRVPTCADVVHIYAAHGQLGLDLRVVSGT